MKNPIYKIKIDNLVIRCAEHNDAKAQKEAIDASLEHLHEFMLWSHYEPESIEKKQERIKRWRKDYLENKDYSVVVFDGEKLVACAGLHTRLEGNALEIGYWVRADEVKKGIASKISVALTILALEYIKVDEVAIHHNIKNTVSAKVPQKLNFQRQENYFDKDDGVENGRWIMNQSGYIKSKKHLNSFYKEIAFFEKA
ncbi:MAG: GNAT family N-acetyltransferase [Chitinophagales bacterium]